MAGLAAVVGGLAHLETHRFTLRRAELAILPEGADAIRICHISDIHLLPGQRDKIAWLQSLARLQPHLVVNTGDNLASPDALPALLRALGPLLQFTGAFVFGSNDYFSPRFRNPLSYLRHGRSHHGPVLEPDLPWQQMAEAFTDAGWQNLTHRDELIELGGLRVELRGTDDAHIERAHYEVVAGPPNPQAQLSIGVTHAPYLRMLDAMTADGLDLILAGHTHGGQVCLPTGAIITNCDIDPARVKGLSSHTASGRTSALHVSAGLGNSPFAPYRTFCRPEATLLTLVAKAH